MRVDVFGVLHQTKISQGQVAKEFELVQEYSARLATTKTRLVGQSEMNQNRNRFVDIIPYDDNYVNLQKEQGLPPSTYVNASYIDDLEGIGKVIVTQVRGHLSEVHNLAAAAAGSEAEHGAGLLAPGGGAQVGPPGHAHQHGGEGPGQVLPVLAAPRADAPLRRHQPLHRGGGRGPPQAF
jgi:hypothetical protein